VNLVVQLSGFDLAEAEVFAQTVKRLIEGLVSRNREYMRRHPLPQLYRSGVLYARDPLGVVSIADAPTVLARKWGHCAHLSAWLCAELNEQGVDAAIRLKWQPRADWRGQLYHVQVRLPAAMGPGPRGLGQVNDPTNEEGQILDPSRMLGMGRL
jgi:hypothetical protein